MGRSLGCRLLAGAVAACLVAGASRLTAQEPPPAVPSEPEFPAHLRGVDFDRPSHVAFQAWPRAELIERLYPWPWVSIAFRRAALFQQPVFMMMSVPWNRQAQRMAQDTLADPRVLRAVNDGYITVVVDADRRPDIRERYQTGTWPVNAFLLPNGKPILSQANPQGVALPITFGFADPERMLFFLQQGQIYWFKWSDLLLGVGEEWARREADIVEPRQEGPAAEAASDAVSRWLIGNFDPQAGGFEAAPKFVIAGLVEYARLREARLVPALAGPAETTQEKLVSGPLYDGREGGVHRMAAAPGWRVIQYEKMLEGNAELLRDLSFFLRSKESAQVRAALQGTARFLTGVLARPEGGFYLAQAADSTTPDGGGYWTAAERPASAPALDRLVLSGPNATAGAALLRAGALLGDEGLERAGRRALDLVLEHGYQAGRGVAHVLEPFPEPFRFLWGQADVAFALVDAHESTGDPRYLRAARDIVDFCIHNLLVDGEKIFRDRLADASPIGLLANPRHPVSPNARLARAMLRLSLHGQGESYRDRARAVLEGYAGDLTQYKVHGVEPALAIEELVRDPLEITIQGAPEDPRTRALRRAAIAVAWPWSVVRSGSAEGDPSATLRYADEQVTVTEAGEVAGKAFEITPHPQPLRP